MCVVGLGLRASRIHYGGYTLSAGPALSDAVDPFFSFRGERAEVLKKNPTSAPNTNELSVDLFSLYSSFYQRRRS